MDMDEIRTFVAIARVRSFSRAAHVVHRSQPAISRRIDLLEDELGAPLFERLRGGVVLTDAGAALLPHAEAALAAVKHGADAVRAVRGGTEGTITFALVGTLANAALTGVLRTFRRRHPKVRIDLQTATSREVGDLVRQGAATLGLRYGADPRADVDSTTVVEEKLVVVCAADHRLARGGRHRPADLAGERWVAFPARPRREAFVDFLAARLALIGVHDPEIVPIDSLTAQKRLVEAGFGIALLPETAIEEERRMRTLRVVHVPELRAFVPVCVVHRKDGYLGPAARNLLADLIGRHD